MILFYTSNIENQLAYLEAEEARHCTQVLRKKTGDKVHFVDGNGGFYEGILQEVHKRNCTIRIIKSQIPFKPRPFRLHIAIAPTKNNSRFEWFLEKATELGIDEITPIICQHSERRKLRIDRLQKVLVAAMKQSLKAYLPILNEPISFKQFTTLPRTNTAKYIAQGQEKLHLKNNYEAGNDVLVMIGPEGDFAEEELLLAAQNDFRGVNLGKSRLRTETAGLVACHVLNLLCEE